MNTASLAGSRIPEPGPLHGQQARGHRSYQDCGARVRHPGHPGERGLPRRHPHPHGEANHRRAPGARGRLRRHRADRALGSAFGDRRSRRLVASDAASFVTGHAMASTAPSSHSSDDDLTATPPPSEVVDPRQLRRMPVRALADLRRRASQEVGRLLHRPAARVIRRSSAAAPSLPSTAARRRSMARSASSSAIPSRRSRTWSTSPATPYPTPGGSPAGRLGRRRARPNRRHPLRWLRIPSISAHPDRAGDVARSARFNPLTC